MTTQTGTLEIDVGSDGEDAETLDAFTRELLYEVRQMPVESAELKKHRSTPEGTKAIEFAAIGTLIVGLGTNAAWDAIKMLCARLQRREHAMVRYDGVIQGHPVKFKGSPDAFVEMVSALVARPPQAPPNE